MDVIYHQSRKLFWFERLPPHALRFSKFRQCKAPDFTVTPTFLNSQVLPQFQQGFIVGISRRIRSQGI